MLNILKKIKNINYVYLKNGIIKDSNIDLTDFNFKKDIKFILIHDIDSDTLIDIKLNDNVSIKMLELFNVKGNCKITKNINLNDFANLDLVTIESSNDNFNIEINNNVNIKNNSNLNNMKISIFNSIVSEFDKSNMDGNKSKLENMNVYINSSGYVQNIDSIVTHNFKNSESVMTNYGICKNKSTININTNGVIVKGAKGTNIRQKSKGILLDFDSTIEANPWLQIDEYDCLASHGAGIGAIDEEELYYLMSRGLDRLTSEKLIIGGFINPVFEKINEIFNSNEINDYVFELVNKYL